jgi:hypothetical protein
VEFKKEYLFLIQRFKEFKAHDRELEKTGFPSIRISPSSGFSRPATPKRGGLP